MQIDEVRPQDLSKFSGKGYDKGRGLLVQAAWFATLNLLFMKWWLPYRIRPILLRFFGADVGQNVFIRHRVRVLWPWKLRIGSNVWIGEDAWLLNLEEIAIGDNCCLSQRASLVAGSHSASSRTFEYDNGPITIGNNCWVAFDAIILRGVELADGTVVGARNIVRSDTSRNVNMLK